MMNEIAKPEVGMKVRDANGRVGVITEVRDDGFFARPADTPYVAEHDIPGMGKQKLIMATYWNDKGNGVYHGLWADAPLNAWTTVQIDEASNA